MGWRFFRAGPVRDGIVRDNAHGGVGSMTALEGMREGHGVPRDAAV